VLVGQYASSISYKAVFALVRFISFVEILSMAEKYTSKVLLHLCPVSHEKCRSQREVFANFLFAVIPTTYYGEHYLLFVFSYGATANILIYPAWRGV